MQTVPLTTEPKKEGAVARDMRTEGRVPCVVYGNDVEHTEFTCDYSELFRVYSKAGESVVVVLELGGKKVPVLFHELQFAPVSDKILHVDFYALDMKKEIEAHVPVEFIGSSAAVDSAGAVLVTVNDTLTVRCLPTVLPQHLEASIESLKEFGDSILVSAVAVPEGVVIVEEPDTMLATVQEPRAPEPEETEDEAGEAAEGEGEGEGEGGGEDGDKKEEGGEEKSE